VLDDGATLLRRLTPQSKARDIADFQQTVPPQTPVPPVAPPAPMVPATTHAPDAENDVAILRDPDNPVRFVTNNLPVSYTLKQAAASAALDFLDSHGDVARTIPLPTTAGTRTQNWNLRYESATSFAGLIYWSADNNGPRAPLGTHSVRLTVDGQSLTQSFEVLKDSRLEGIISDADVQEQFELALQGRNRTSDANQGVINIRDCTAQIDARIAAANDSEVTPAWHRIEERALRGRERALPDAVAIEPGPAELRHQAQQQDRHAPQRDREHREPANRPDPRGLRPAGGPAHGPARPARRNRRQRRARVQRPAPVEGPAADHVQRGRTGRLNHRRRAIRTEPTARGGARVTAGRHVG
jgi:hypothetical protein